MCPTAAVTMGASWTYLCPPLCPISFSTTVDLWVVHNVLTIAEIVYVISVVTRLISEALLILSFDCNTV